MFGKNKTNCHREEDRIWRTSSAKIKGLLDDSRRLCSEGHPVVILVHFEETLRLIQDACLAANISAEKVSSVMALTRKIASPELYLMMVDRIQPAPAGGSVEGSDVPFYALIAEHHPLVDEDRIVREFLETFGRPYTLAFYDSLDSPLFAMFGGERLTAMLDRLGLKPDDVISHVLVTSAIENAQRKIQRSTSSRLQARSAAEWFQYNYTT